MWCYKRSLYLSDLVGNFIYIKKKVNMTSYINMEVIRVALNRVIDSKSPKDAKDSKVSHYEHTVGTVSCALLQHYFPLANGWIITPEQRQIHLKKPDFVVEKLSNKDLIPHIFVECKKHKGDSFDKIMRQVSVAATMAAEFKSQDDFSVFVIACRGLEIAFFEYYNYHTVLDESNIYHYEGLIPLTCPLDKQEDYFRKLTPLTLTSIPTSQDELTNLGVKSSREMEHSYIWDLSNAKHQNYIHMLFLHMIQGSPRQHVIG